MAYNVYFFGDSITAGVGCTNAYHMILAEYLNINAYNWGIGGAGFVREISGSTTVGGGVQGIGTVQTESGGNNVIGVMTGKTFDACVVFSGTNDYGHDVDMTTFSNTVRSTLQYAKTVTNKILIITPLKRLNYETANGAGYTLANYADTIKSIANDLSVAYYDGFNFAVDPSDTSIMPDGLHPNNAGHLIIANEISPYLSQIINGGGNVSVSTIPLSAVNQLTHRKTAGTYTALTHYGAYGYVTSSGNNAYIYVPMVWDIRINSVTISSLITRIRSSTGGYLGGTNGLDVTAYITSVVVAKAQGLLLINLTKSDGWGMTNNTTFTGEVTMSYTVSV